MSIISLFPITSRCTWHGAVVSGYSCEIQSAVGSVLGAGAWPLASGKWHWDVVDIDDNTLAEGVVRSRRQARRLAETRARALLSRM